MAEYEDLFPNGDPNLMRPFKPINPQALGGQMGGRVRSALNVGGSTTSSETPDFDFSSIDGLLAKKPEGGVGARDFGRAAMAGLGSLGSAVMGAGEYAAGAVADEGETPLEQGAADLRNQFTTGRIKTEMFAQDQVAAMSPDAQARLSREWLTLDPNRTIWQGGADEFVSSLALKVSQAAPSTLATLLPGALLLRAGMGSGAVAYLGASEGGLSLGSIAANVASEIEQAPEEELMQSPRYQQLVEEVGPEQARTRLIQEAQGYAPVIGGLVVGAIGAAAGRYLEPVFVDKAAGAAARFTRGFGSEAIQESTQSGTEQTAQNIAAQVFDSGRATFEGVPETMVEGAAIGGIMGGATTAAVGRRPEAPNTPPEPTQEPLGVDKAGLPADIQAALWASIEPPSNDDTPPPGLGGAGVDPYSGQIEMFPRAGQESVAGELGPEQAPAEDPNAWMQDPEKRAAYVANPFPYAQQDLDFGDRPVANVPGQGELRLPVRQRGGERVDAPGTVPPPPGAPDLSQPDRAAVVAEGQGDLFDAPPTSDEADLPPGRRTITRTGAPGPRQQAGFAVRVRNEAGELTGEDIFPTADEANAAAEQIADADPNAFVQVERAYSRAAAPSTSEEVVDAPSPEPLTDIRAQLADLKAGTRDGVYLSSANLTSLSQRGLTEQARGVGVPLTNFDGKGGTLIAKDRATAELLLDQRDAGIDMQEIIGLATGAGRGKPAGASIVVQQRDASGAVTRESLVQTAEEADALADKWTTGGRTAQILSTAAAIRRRNQLIKGEDREAQNTRDRREVSRKVEDATLAELGNTAEQYRVQKAATGDGKVADVGTAAKRVADVAAGEEAIRIVKQIEGVDRPEFLDFGTAKKNAEYADIFGKLRDSLLAAELAESTEDRMRSRAQAKRHEQQAKAYIRINKPQSTAQRVARVATKLDPQGTAKKVRNSTSGRSSEQDDIGPLEIKSEEEVNALADDEVDAEFVRAATYASGRVASRPRKRAEKVEGEPDRGVPAEMIGEGSEIELASASFDDIVAANPTLSQRRKFIARMQRNLRARRFGSGKVRPITRVAAEVRTGKSTRAERRGQFDPSFLLNAEPAKADAEMSAEKRIELREKIKAARAEMLEGMAGFVQLFRKLAKDAKDSDYLFAGADRIYGRAYVQSLLRFGRALYSADPKSAKGLQQITLFNKLVTQILEGSPAQQVKTLSRLMRAESRENVIGATALDPKLLRRLRDPEKRMLITLKTNQQVVAGNRLHEVWKKHSLFNSTIHPFMQKLVAHAMNDAVYDSPTLERELKSVRFALTLMRSDPATRDAFYKPFRQWMTEFGFEFSDKGTLLIPKRDGKVAVPDAVTVARRYNRRFGQIDTDILVGSGMSSVRSPDGSELVPPVADSATPAALFAQREAKIRAITAANPMVTEAQARQQVMSQETAWIDNDFITERGAERAAATQALNKAVRQLRKAASSDRTSDLDLIAAEQAFVDYLKESGLTTESKVPGMLRIRLPNGATRQFRLVTPRFRTGKITKAEAREAILDLYREQPISQESSRSDQIKAKAANTFAKVNRQRTASYKKAERERELAMTPEQRKLKEAYERRERDGRSLNLLDSSATASDYREAGRDLMAAMNASGGEMSLNDALVSLWSKLPRNSVFTDVAQQVLDLNLSVDVSWGEGMGNVTGNFGWTRGGLMQITLNKAKFDAITNSGGDPSAMLAHALLHEATHAATAGALRNNANVKAVVERLMFLSKLGGVDQKLYGMKDADEFVAEAFTNPNFQNELRKIKFERTSTIWQAFKALVARVLGLNNVPEYDNVLEAVLSLSDQLFTGEVVGGGSLNMEDSVSDKIMDVVNRTKQTKDTVKRLQDAATDAGESGSGFLLSAMTMEQIRDFYGQYFETGREGGLVDRAPMEAYWKAYTNRNSDNAESMEKADKISRRWTELTEKHGAEVMTKLSRLMHEATVFELHPDLPLTDKANEHVTQVARKVKHAELAKQFRDLDPAIQQHYKSVRDFYRTTLAREVNLMTLNALRGYVASGANPVMSRDAFTKRFTEDSVAELKLNTKDGLRAQFTETQLDKAAISTILKLASIPGKFKGPYFPLSRFGNYTVYARRTRNTEAFSTKEEMQAYRDQQAAADPTLEIKAALQDGSWVVTVSEVDFRTFENRSDAEEARKEMQAEYGPKAVGDVALKESFYAKDATIGNDTALDTLLKKLEGNNAAQAAMKNFYLRSLSDRSFRKHEARRKNVRGVDPAIQHRTFASYSKSAAYYTAQLRFGWRMAEAKSKMKEWAKSGELQGIDRIKIQQVVGEVLKRDEMTTDPNEIGKWVRRGTTLSHFMLLTSPSYWLINATQPYLVTLPWLLARQGKGSAVAAMKNAQALIASPLLSQTVSSAGGLKALTSKVAAEKAFTVLEQVEAHIKERAGERADDYIDMLQRLKRQSIIDMSFVAELRDIAEGTDSSMTQRVLDASRIMSHLTEVNNRILTAIAAYDLSKANGRSHVEATEFAKRAVSLTQFNYSGGNKPRLFQQQGQLGNLGPLIFQFMQYPQHMYALMVGEFLKLVRGGRMEKSTAIKTLGGIFATHLAAGGILGAALQPLKWAIGAAIMGFNDEDDEVKDVLSGEVFDRAIREGAAEMFGDEMGLLLSKGIPAAAGTDLSSRMSLGQLYFVDLKPETAESFWGSLVMSFGGPLPGMASTAWKGAQSFAEGDYLRGLEGIAPKAIKDVMRFYRYGEEGLTNQNGATIIDSKKMTPLALFYQSFGFQPTQVSEAYDAQAAITSRKRTDEQGRADIMKRFLKAKTPEERADVREMVREFNMNAPVNPITYSSLIKGMQRARERDLNISRYGADLRGRQVRYAEEADPYATE